MTERQRQIVILEDHFLDAIGQFELLPVGQLIRRRCNQRQAIHEAIVRVERAGTGSRRKIHACTQEARAFANLQLVLTHIDLIRGRLRVENEVGVRRCSRDRLTTLGKANDDVVEVDALSVVPLPTFGREEADSRDTQKAKRIVTPPENKIAWSNLIARQNSSFQAHRTRVIDVMADDPQQVFMLLDRVDTRTLGGGILQEVDDGGTRIEQEVRQNKLATSQGNASAAGNGVNASPIVNAESGTIDRSGDVLSHFVSLETGSLSEEDAFVPRSHTRLTKATCQAGIRNGEAEVKQRNLQLVRSCCARTQAACRIKWVELSLRTVALDDDIVRATGWHRVSQSAVIRDAVVVVGRHNEAIGIQDQNGRVELRPAREHHGIDIHRDDLARLGVVDSIPVGVTRRCTMRSIADPTRCHHDTGCHKVRGIG